MTYLVASLTLDSAGSYVMQGAHFTQGTIPSIPIGGSISPEGFLPSILLLVVIIVTVVIVIVILIVVVVDDVSFILKHSFVIIEIREILAHCHSGPTECHLSALFTGRKVYEVRLFWPSIFKDAKDYIMRCDACQRSRNISSRSEMPQNNIQVEAQALPTNDARVVIKFLRRLFVRFGVPKALISDRGTLYVVDDDGKISKLALMEDHVESCLQQMKVRSIMIKGY
ncbi:reverse transcriptase domain-containing protein [Tanacetum coccineum]